MPSPFVTAFGTIAGGQDQSNQATAMYQQQMRERALQEQIQREELMLKMQDAMQTEQALKSLPADQQPYARLGQLGPYMAQQQKTKGAGLSADAFRAQALQEKDPRKQQALNLAADMLANGANEAVVNRFLSINGLTGSVGTSALAQMQAEHPGITVEEALAGIAKAQGRGADTTELKPIYDPKTGTTSLTYVPKTGAAGTSVGEVRPTLGASAQANIDTTAQGLKQLDEMIGPKPSNVPMIGAKLKTLVGIAPNAAQTEVMGQISLVHTTLIGMVTRAWGSRNPQKADEITRYHIPQVGDSPQLVKQKIHDWMKPRGYLDQYREMVGMTEGGGGGDELPEGAVPLP